MEENQEMALTQMRKSVEKLGSSTEVNQSVPLSHNAIFKLKLSFLINGLSLAGVWEPNNHEVLDCKVNGPRQSSQDVCPVAELEGFNGAQWVHF